VSIILKQGGQVSLLRSGEFNVESEMESLVAHHPDLLQSEADPELRLVARQVSLGEAGLLDVLLVSEDGLPIAVETKLGSNGESRRELVAQAVDYISSMTPIHKR
jgi:RecB family endonuclease NucS